MTFRKSLLVTAIGMATVAVAIAQKPMFNGERQLKQPSNWREWVFVGSPVTPNDMNGGKAPFPEFHNVYVNPKAYREYSKTGRFPDGTMMAKELVSVGTKAASSGKGYFQGEFLGLEVALKDSKKYAADGGWAFFSFSRPDGLKESADAFPGETCAACHQANAGDDLVFTQYYPVLRAAKAKGQ